MNNTKIVVDDEYSRVCDYNFENILFAVINN